MEAYIKVARQTTDKRIATSLILRQSLATSPTMHGIKTVTEKIKPLRWEVFGLEAIPQLEEHTAKAAIDIWWTWPEAIAWIGSRDYRNIATLRHWGDWWKGEAAQRLEGQAIIATTFCTSPKQVEASLIKAIEAGAIKSSGRSKPDASSVLLDPGTWRGGAIIFSHGTACLVSKLDMWSAPWAFDIAVNRADLVDCSGDGKNLNAACRETYSGRAPSTKAGRAPSDEEILAKAEEMKARGLRGRTIAKEMRHEAGFANVATTTVRDLIKGKWKPAGRPKKGA